MDLVISIAYVSRGRELKNSAHWSLNHLAGTHQGSAAVRGQDTQQVVKAKGSLKTKSEGDQVPPAQAWLLLETKR